MIPLAQQPDVVSEVLHSLPCGYIPSERDAVGIIELVLTLAADAAAKLRFGEDGHLWQQHERRDFAQWLRKQAEAREVDDS